MRQCVGISVGVRVGVSVRAGVGARSRAVGVTRDLWPLAPPRPVLIGEHVSNMADTLNPPPNRGALAC